MPTRSVRVLVVVADDRRDRVLVERPDLLGVRGEHAEQQPVGAGADVLGDRAAGAVGAAQDVEHELGLLDRAAELGRVGVEGRDADDAVALQALGERRRAAALAAPRRRRRQAAARRRGRPCAGRARPGTRRRSSPRRGAAGPSSARRTARPRRARGRSRAARRGARPRPGRVVGARAQLLEERAAQVLLDLLARLGDRDLGQRRRPPRGAGTRRGLSRPRRASARAPTVSSPVVIGTSRPRAAAPRPGGRERDRSRSAAAPRCRPPRPATAPPAPSRGTTIATGPPAASAASSATRSSPSPASTASTICQVDGAQALDEGRRPRPGPDSASRGPPAASGVVGSAHDVLRLRPRSGWACSVSSPDSPVRMR